MKTSLEVLDIILHATRTNKRRALSLQESGVRWSILNSWIDVLDLNQAFNWRAEIWEPFKMELIWGLRSWTLRGWSHQPIQTPYVGISGCNSVKNGGPTSISEHNPYNFMVGTEWKVWCDQGMRGWLHRRVETPSVGISGCKSISTLGQKGMLSKCALKGSKHALILFRVALRYRYLHTGSSTWKTVRNISCNDKISSWFPKVARFIELQVDEAPECGRSKSNAHPRG
jgi:hypothetical protein